MSEQRTIDPVAGCMTPKQRAEIEQCFQRISEIMRSLNKVKLSGGWRVEGMTLDGRTVVHKFSVGGYEKAPPRVRGYLGSTPWGEIDDSP